jgi:hypothetical protein
MSMASETFEQAVERLRGLGFEFDRPVAELDGWQFGEAVRILEDDEDNGIFEGAEGWIGFERVGSAEYHTERVQPVFYEQHYDSGNEVSLDNIEAVARG